MLSALIVLGTVVLILFSVAIVFLILMQRASSNAGMGSALGGDAAESALGGAAGNTLSKLTERGIAGYLLVALLLFLGQLAMNIDKVEESAAGLEDIESRLEEKAAQAAATKSTVEKGALTDIDEDSLEAAIQATQSEGEGEPFSIELPIPAAAEGSLVDDSADAANVAPSLTETATDTDPETETDTETETEPETETARDSEAVSEVEATLEPDAEQEAEVSGVSKADHEPKSDTGSEAAVTEPVETEPVTGEP